MLIIMLAVMYEEPPMLWVRFITSFNIYLSESAITLSEDSFFNFDNFNM